MPGCRHRVLINYRAEVELSYQSLNSIYSMALSHKDWEIPNSGIWLAEMDIDRSLDFPTLTGV